MILTKLSRLAPVVVTDRADKMGLDVVEQIRWAKKLHEERASRISEEKASAKSQRRGKRTPRYHGMRAAKIAGTSGQQNTK